jgi:hypothetical protein
MAKKKKMTTRMPSLSAMDTAAKVCTALAERARKEEDWERAKALEMAADICEAKAFVGAVAAAHRGGYFKEWQEAQKAADA